MHWIHFQAALIKETQPGCSADLNKILFGISRWSHLCPLPCVCSLVCCILSMHAARTEHTLTSRHDGCLLPIQNRCPQLRQASLPIAGTSVLDFQAKKCGPVSSTLPLSWRRTLEVVCGGRRSRRCPVSPIPCAVTALSCSVQSKLQLRLQHSIARCKRTAAATRDTL